MKTTSDLYKYTVASIYLLMIIGVELVMVSYAPGWGVAIYGVLLISLLFYATIDRESREFMLSMTAVPVFRLVNYGFPITQLPLSLRLLVVGLCMTGVILTMTRLPEFQSLSIFQKRSNWLIQGLIALSGVAIGYGQYLLLAPSTSHESLTVIQVIVLAIIFVFMPGFVEEVIFRGIMLSAATEYLGETGAILYTAMLYTSLFIHTNSALYCLLIFVVAFLYAYMVRKTSNLYGVIASHSISALICFVVLPYLAS